MNKSQIYKNSKDEWYTPDSVINYIKSLVGTITLDPATTEQNAKRMNIEKYYTKETNGLDKDWQGEVVWLNPPFSNKKEWIAKAREEANKGNCKIFILLPMALETIMFHTDILNNAIIHIPNKRISFIDGDTHEQQKDVPFTTTIIEVGKIKSASFGSCIVELTKEPNNTYKTFILPNRGEQ